MLLGGLLAALPFGRELEAAQEELASERKRGEEAAEQHRTLLKEATSDAAKRSLEDVDALRTRHAQALDDQAKDSQEQLAKAVAQAIAAEKSRGEAAQAKAAPNESATRPCRLLLSLVGPSNTMRDPTASVTRKKPRVCPRWARRKAPC